MRINIKVITGASRNEVINEGNLLKVKVTARPHEGKANRAVINLLSHHYKVRKSDIRIIRGERSSEKVVEILGS